MATSVQTDLRDLLLCEPEHVEKYQQVVDEMQAGHLIVIRGCLGIGAPKLFTREEFEQMRQGADRGEV